jgi:hypothetical protein
MFLRERNTNMDNRITTIANYIMDKPEAGWSLQDILDAIRCEPSGVPLLRSMPRSRRPQHRPRSAGNAGRMPLPGGK